MHLNCLHSASNTADDSCVVPIVLFVVFIIFQACSKESIDNENENYNNSSDYNLLWQSGTSYETTIQVGETITWTWGGGTHNLRSTGGTEMFDSGIFYRPWPSIFLHVYDSWSYNLHM